MSGTVVPVVLSAAGRANTPPATLQSAIATQATLLSPGLTTNLPGTLIEDIVSTDTGAAIIIDQAVTETISSLTPYGANAYTLLELAQIYLGQGSTAAGPSNTAVYVVFTSNSPGYVIPPGFVVADTTYQYTVIDGGAIGAAGTSIPIFCRATQTGSWAVPPNSVQSVITSIPGTIGGNAFTLTVTNPLAGTEGGPAESIGDFRARILTSGIATSTGMPNMLKALLANVPGVQSNLVSVRIAPGPAWEIIVGGTGDPFAIAYAIFFALFDISTLTGSTLSIVGISTANPGVVTTNLVHGYATGQLVTMVGIVGPSDLNNTPTTITVLTPTSFSLGVDTTSMPAYVSGGVVTPNFRNTSASIISYPDTYNIPFVIPPVQPVSVTVTWNTSSLNFVSPTTVAGLVQVSIAAYVNGISVGQPINVLELNDAFVTAVAGILPEYLITTLVFAVTISGVLTPVGTGTQIISGDPEGYFSCTSGNVAVIQG